MRTLEIIQRDVHQASLRDDSATLQNLAIELGDTLFTVEPADNEQRVLHMRC